MVAFFHVSFIVLRVYIFVGNAYVCYGLPA